MSDKPGRAKEILILILYFEGTEASFKAQR